MANGNLQAALKALNELKKKDLNEELQDESRLVRGEILEKKKRYAEAMKLYHRVAVDGFNRDMRRRGLSHLGKCLRKMGKTREAALAYSGKIPVSLEVLQR
jgi:tetratricopeptide (TPR) repeat protein